jgi:hypothetical protein
MGAAGFAFAADGDFSLGVGANYSTGKYGTPTETKIWSIPFSARYETDVWTLKLTVPYLRVTGPANVIPDVGNTSDSGRRRRTTRAPTTTESGLGDVVAAATYNAYWDSAAKRGLDLTGKIKFGTADSSKGLGTGENDYTVAVEPAQKLGPVSLFGTFGYKFLGDPPGSDLNNVFFGSVGASYKFADGLNAGLILDLQERTSDTAAGPQREATAFVSQRFLDHWKAQLYVVHGFADGSPDWGGAAIAYAF